MPWIESHTELAHHPKTKRLARLLGVSRPTAIGHLHLLWWWALEYTRDGDLSAFSDEEVADECCWEGPPAAFRRALTAVGFLDDSGAIHDWDTYTGRLMEQRERNREQSRLRMQAFRERQRNAQVVTEDVTRNGYAPVTQRYAPTVPNRTKPDRTGPPPTTATEVVVAPADADAPLAVTTRPASGRRQDVHWETLEAIFGPCKTRTERDGRNAACAQFREGGATPDEMRLGAANWPNVMGRTTITPHGLAKHLGLLLHGPQVNGRSDGTVQEHRQRLTQTAHAPTGSRALIEQKRAQRRDN